MSAKKGGLWQARVSVGLKSEVLDPQGKAVRNALGSLGFRAVKDVRVGKHFWLVLDGALSKAAAEKEVRRLSDKVLVNPVIETFSFTLARAGAPSREAGLTRKA